MRRILCVLCVTASACSGSSTPAVPTPAPSPAPIATATLQASGQGQFLSCVAILNICTFQGEVTNAGAGCATAVTGVTRFLNAQQQQIGSAFSWSLPGTRVVRPSEAFTYDVISVPQNTAISTYTTQPAWTNTKCP